MHKSLLFVNSKSIITKRINKNVTNYYALFFIYHIFICFLILISNFPLKKIFCISFRIHTYIYV